MTLASANSASESGFRYGNPAADCDGAQIRAQCRHLAIVVTISGEINDSNIDRVRQSVRRFILAEKPLVLDLSGVGSFPRKVFRCCMPLMTNVARRGWSGY